MCTAAVLCVLQLCCVYCSCVVCTAFVLFVLQVLDENDNAPAVLEPAERVVSVRERQPAGTALMQVLATDPDTGDNASLQYTFSTGGGSCQCSVWVEWLNLLPVAQVRGRARLSVSMFNLGRMVKLTSTITCEGSGKAKYGNAQLG